MQSCYNINRKVILYSKHITYSYIVTNIVNRNYTVIEYYQVTIVVPLFRIIFINFPFRLFGNIHNNN